MLNRFCEFFARFYLHRIDVHVLQHLWVSVAAYIEHNVFSVASLELIDEMKIEKCLRDKRLHCATRFPRDHMNKRLIAKQ